MPSLDDSSLTLPADHLDRLDRFDRAILEQLQQDGRMSNQALADAVALSPSPCLRRVKRLEEAGLIKRYVALLAPEKIGLGLLAFVSVRLQKFDGRLRHAKSPIEDFAAAVATWKEVVSCYVMTGEADYLMRVHVQDMAHFSEFVMQRLMTHPAVVDVKSSFALQAIKETTALPLP
ncbi:Lrp/AsnC family transcriptional regulator [Parvibium lacunae]|uniref:Lrp/AsnC family transcriptional regulator n=1 Tax=Parvibium lacunae TaxID=1888893 RepID=A0A368L0Z3_9BURK|nr:Lrp/AsnC family transcriptional regulator [Parvibium lacunae]RCS57087.1 Lrp/AsnC family transcriptional regulator [Parvibium lacunae]